jgi:hypothetical protein
MKEGYPLKFYADLEFEPSKYEENMPKEAHVNEMCRIFKEYVERQWEMDTGRFVTTVCYYWRVFSLYKSYLQLPNKFRRETY